LMMEMDYEKDSEQRKRYVETISISYFVDSDAPRFLWEYYGSWSYSHASIKQYPRIDVDSINCRYHDRYSYLCIKHTNSCIVYRNSLAKPDFDTCSCCS